MTVQILLNKTSNMKTIMTRHRPFFLFGSLVARRFLCCFFNRIQLILYCLRSVAGFSVEASVMLLSPMLPTFLNLLVTDKIFFCIHANALLASPTWQPCLCFNSQYGCQDVICIRFMSAQIP